MWGKADESLIDAASEDLVDPIWLEDSYRRCERAGLDRGTIIGATPGESRLAALLNQRQSLRAFLVRLLVDAGCHFSEPHVLLLTDSEGTVALLQMSPTAAPRAALHGMAVGSSLGEAAAGTTAVALSLRHGVPVTLSGPQHFCRVLSDCCCYAAPILDEQGKATACVAAAVFGEEPRRAVSALVAFIARELEYFPLAPLDPDAPAAATVGLTVRQQQVLALFAQGLSYKQIAKELNVRSRKTVEDHLDAIRAKLGTASRRECIRRAIDLGLLKD